MHKKMTLKLNKLEKMRMEDKVYLLNVNNMLIFYKESERVYVSKQIYFIGGCYEKNIQKTYRCFTCFSACTF